MTQSSKRRNHPRGLYGPWRVQAGTILIWRVNRCSGIKYLVPISAQEIFPWAIVCAAAARKAVPKPVWLSSSLIHCLEQTPASSFKWIAGIPVKPFGIRHLKKCHSHWRYENKPYSLSWRPSLKCSGLRGQAPKRPIPPRYSGRSRVLDSSRVQIIKQSMNLNFR